MIGCSWRSGANQSMLVWELTLYKARFGTLKHHSELIFEKHQNAQDNEETDSPCRGDRRNEVYMEPSMKTSGPQAWMHIREY